MQSNGAPSLANPAVQDIAISEKRSDFDLNGYAVELHERASDTLIVTFPSAAKSRNSSPRDEKAWGREFVARRGYSALHVKTNINCWFRRPALIDFFSHLRETGVFDGYRRIMTYGGSMGGYGALAYAGLCKATHCLSLNPQAHLGPSVRDWERRFRGADLQDWSDTRLDLQDSLQAVRRIAVVYDPCHAGDTRHINMIPYDGLVRLHVPFVGHKIPTHLQKLGQLAWLFDAMIEDRLEPGEFHGRVRGRRTLDIWRKIMFDRAGQSACRREVLLRHFPDGGTGIEEDADE